MSSRHGPNGRYQLSARAGTTGAGKARSMLARQVDREYYDHDHQRTEREVHREREQDGPGWPNDLAPPRSSELTSKAIPRAIVCNVATAIVPPFCNCRFGQTC
jgi:hypothetical protein